MDLVSVTVSVGHGDYLAVTLAQNRHIFNRQLIVTSHDDEETLRVADYHGVEAICTDVFYERGQVFNKGAAINLGLEHLDFKGWALHLDADIVLPPQARKLLETTSLNEQCLYGCDRWNCTSYESWMDFISSPQSFYDNGWLHQPPFIRGGRLISEGDGNYLPIGYFQLFHRESAYLGKPFYPTNFDTAAYSDTEFSRRWPRTHRHLLPEIDVIHLCTDDQKQGANWDGRTTKRFGPKKSPFHRKVFVPS